MQGQTFNRGALVIGAMLAYLLFSWQAEVIAYLAALALEATWDAYQRTRAARAGR